MTQALPESAEQPRTSILGPGYRRLTGGIVVAVLIIAFEAMAVATAMPVAVRDLQGLSLYAWGFSAYLTTSLFAMVVAGEQCDARGPRLPVLVGLATFAVGLVVGGTAPTMPVFVLGRAVQGLGGGLVIVALYVVVGRSYPEHLQPRVFSAMSSAWVLPSLLGPALSGWLADTWSWRAVFLLVAPCVVVTLLVVLPNLARMDGSSGAPSRRGRKRLALAAAVGAALLQYGGQHVEVLPLVLGVVGLALLVVAVPRLLPRGTLRAARGLPTSVLLRGVLSGAYFGGETFLPLMLIEERGLSTSMAGLSLTAGSLAWALGSWIQGRPSTNLSRGRLVQIGAVCVGIANAGVALAILDPVPWAVAGLAWCFGGFGMGLAMSSFSVLVLQQSAPEEQGVNSAALQISDGLGSILLVGVAGAVFAGLHAADHTRSAFLLIDAVMVAVALVGATLALRVRHA